MFGFKGMGKKRKEDEINEIKSCVWLGWLGLKERKNGGSIFLYDPPNSLPPNWEEREREKRVFMVEFTTKDTSLHFSLTH